MPLAAGQLADRGVRLLVDPRRQEALELPAAAIDDTQGRIPGAGQLGGGRHEPLQERLERELRGDRHGRLEQRAQAAFAGSHGFHCAAEYREPCGKPTS